jgi:hypothetical protein
MKTQFSSVKNKLLFDRFYTGKTLFYKKCNNYYYARVGTFDRLFDIIVIGLGIFQPALMQGSENTWDNVRMKERKKLKIIRDCIWMGKEMIRERETDFFKAEVKADPPYMKCFYISQKEFDNFITDIVMPLLKLVETAGDYKWKKLEGKKGFWRDFTELEHFCTNEEIHIDPFTQKKMIKLS